MNLAIEGVMKQLQKGDRVRVNVPLLSGWKGKATVISHYPPSNIVEILKDGDEVNEYGNSYCYVCRHELSVMRKLTQDKKQVKK
jgi:hypothetical protein